VLNPPSGYACHLLYERRFWCSAPNIKGKKDERIISLAFCLERP